MTPKRAFGLVLCATLLARFWIAATFPITGDEAYYIQWGRNLDWGYYDQTPMIGWWTWFLQQVSTNLLWLRLPVILLSGWIALLGVRMLSRALARRGENNDLAYAAMSIYLLHPVHVLPIFLAMDVPLLFFTALALERFSREGLKRGDYLWVGAWLGLAFLSKYFAVLMGLAFVLALILRSGPRMAFAPVAWMMLGALPFVFINVYWNSQNCWINYVFNFSTRFGGGGVDLRKSIEYLGFQVYLLSPFLVGYLGFRFRAVHESLRTLEGFKWAMVFAVPFVLFFYSSLTQAQSLHYMLAFTIGVFLLVGLALRARDLKVLKVCMAVFLFAHLCAYAYVLTRDDGFWKKYGFYSHYVLFRHGGEVANALAPKLLGVDRVATDGYTQASVLDYALGRPVSVWGTGSKFGRLDDSTTDWRALEGKRLAIVMRGKPNVAEFERHFTRVQLQEIQVRGVVFHVVLGEGFRAIQYRASLLPEIIERFYPPFLGHPGFACPVRAPL